MCIRDRGSASAGAVNDLKAVPLTGNREMAEDLEREPCPTCGRSFAPSVLCRHAPMCAARALKAQDRKNICPGADGAAALSVLGTELRAMEVEGTIRDEEHSNAMLSVATAAQERQRGLEGRCMELMEALKSIAAERDEAETQRDEAERQLAEQLATAVAPAAPAMAESESAAVSESESASGGAGPNELALAGRLAETQAELKAMGDMQRGLEEVSQKQIEMIAALEEQLAERDRQLAARDVERYQMMEMHKQALRACAPKADDGGAYEREYEGEYEGEYGEYEDEYTHDAEGQESAGTHFAHRDMMASSRGMGTWVASNGATK
eukprot:3962590-Prymnesium_polylepis.1